MKTTKLFITFLIFSLIFNPFASAVIVDSNVFTPTDFATMQTVDASPTILESKILVAGETSTMSTALVDGKISISDSVHTFREVSMNYQMLLDELEGFNGKQIALTHINNAGEIDSRRIVTVSPDTNGYVSVIMEFSTTIVDGFTGTTTTTLTGLSGNQSISVPDGSSYDLNITNNLGVNATGGTLTTDGDYNIHTFTSNGTFTPSTSCNVWAFVVGGGGAGGYINSAGGGGSGGILSEENHPVIYQPYQIAIGLGGIITADYQIGKNGSNSSFDNMTAVGGGSGGNYENNDGQDGGSGGGGGRLVPGTGTVGQGHDGGVGVDGATNNAGGGGGGGSGVVGSIGTTSVGGKGGNGTSYNISGSDVYYAGGGGGGRFDGSPGAGGVGGGGSGGSTANGISGTSNTGGGGGGSGGVRGGDGGSGIVIIKYNTTSVTTESNITASITGDSNTQSYNTSQSREFTLTPTGATNNVLINTNSTDYDVTITTYWTEDTVKISETLSNGYANITVQYTPSNNITAGVINATYNTIDFAAHDYTGLLSVTVDGVDYSSNGTRLLNNVNTTIINFDTSTHYINFSVPYNPPLDLYSPNDTVTLSYAYPPLTHDVVLSWEQSTGTYKYTVTDYDTGATISSSTVSSNTTAVSLPSGQYKWYINGYDDVFDEYSQSSVIRSFTVEDTFSYPNDTVVHGIVYEYILGVQTPLDTALVNIWNGTWSSSSITGVNGYFVFQGLHNSTYSMRATKDGYIDSNIELVTPTFNTTLTRDILLQSSSGAGQQYVDHYVQFIVKSLLGTRYPGVAVNAYLGDAVIAQYTGTTGTDGSVAFELNENLQYRLTFISAAQGINREIILYPVEDAYNVYVIANIFADGGNIISDDISVSITTAKINSTHAHINVTYTDNKTETTALYFYVNQSNINDQQNQTLIASSGEVHATGFYSFTVTDYVGEAYLIHVHITHDTYGDVKESYSVRFEGLLDSFGWDGIWVFIALGCITFTAFMFGAKNATQGSFVICVETWLFIAMDMFGDYNTIWFKAGVAMATLISILANMERHDSERS